MSLWKKYSDKLYLKQWAIGFSRGDIASIIREKKTNLPVKWLSPESNKYSYADPFIFTTADGQMHVLFESVGTVGLDGKITLMTVDNEGNPLEQKTLLETEAHLSYPFVYKENGKIYVFPENAFSGSLFCYEFDAAEKKLKNKIKVIDQPVVDATITKFQDKYWLFGTIVGEFRNSDLHIFYSDSLTGPYTPHPGNPVKRDRRSARPAGSLVLVDGILYRPAQDCSSFYGESIVINKITKLTTTEFAEEEYFTIRANKEDQFNYGVHTINACGDMIILDGQKKYFQPAQQLFRKIKNLF